MKSMFRSLNRSFEKGSEKLSLLWSPFLDNHSITTREINTAEKNEQTIPTIKVIAKPFTGPCPNTYKITAVRNVVTLESIIEL